MIACLSPNGQPRQMGTEPPRRLLAGTVDGIVALERPGPATRWQRVGHALVGSHISALLPEPTRGGIFAAAHSGGLYASADGGQTWQPRGPELAGAHVWTVAAQTVDGAVTLYAGTQPAHLYRSKDYGEHWDEVASLPLVAGHDTWTYPPTPGIGHVKQVSFDPRDPRVIWVGIEQGALLRSADAGQTWRELEGFVRPTDVNFKDVHRVVPSLARPELIYLSSGDGVLRSDDEGETWTPLASLAEYIGYPDPLLLAPDDDQLVIVTGGAAGPPQWRREKMARASVMCSRDGGRTWARLGSGLPDPLRGSIEALSQYAWPRGWGLFAGTTDGEIFASDDRGEHWERIASGLAPISQVSHYRDLELPPAEPVATR